MTPDKNQNRTYFIEEYNPEWIVAFEKIKALLELVFGKNVVSIEHVGSTSIPGMKAKPIIDVLVTVEKMELFEKEKQAMVQAGYEWGKDYIAPNTLIFYKTINGDQKLENIHVCEKNSFKADQFLFMRDFFRAHPEWVEKYTKLKEHLKAKFPNDYVSYRSGKRVFLDGVEVKAREWNKAR